MKLEELITEMSTAFVAHGRALAEAFERRLDRLPRGDSSGWYYIEALGGDTADGRKQATVKPKNGATGAGNPALGPLVCLRSYTPVIGHRVLVRWVAGDRADGVIEG